MNVLIKKADGTTEYFKIEKLRRSLRRSGASPEEVNKIVMEVRHDLYNGIQTQEIYRRAFALLRTKEIKTAARYSLRRALFGLGPSGFPFERFLARLFTAEGYKTQTGTILEGKCATHEIDITAYNDKHSFVGEAKFHAKPGIKTDLQVAMYSYARLLDLQGKKICSEDICTVSEFWLITNTKFTTSAENYANCVGVPLLSFDYPRHNNLHDRIQRLGVYPITVMQTLTPSQIATLISYDIIVCRDLLQNPSIMQHLHLTETKYQEVLSEVVDITNGIK